MDEEFSPEQSAPNTYEFLSEMFGNMTLINNGIGECLEYLVEQEKARIRLIDIMSDLKISRSDWFKAYQNGCEDRTRPEDLDLRLGSEIMWLVAYTITQVGDIRALDPYVYYELMALDFPGGCHKTGKVEIIISQIKERLEN